MIINEIESVQHHSGVHKRRIQVDEKLDNGVLNVIASIEVNSKDVELAERISKTIQKALKEMSVKGVF